MNANTGNQDALPYESYISACMHAAFFVVSCFFFFLKAAGKDGGSSGDLLGKPTSSTSRGSSYHIVWKFTAADECIDHGMELLETSSVSELSWQRTANVTVQPHSI